MHRVGDGRSIVATTSSPRDVATKPSSSSSSSSVDHKVNLLTASLRRPTILKYEKAVAKFYDWLTDERKAVPTSTFHLDDLFTDYLHLLYEDGYGKAEAIASFYGLNLAQPGITNSMPKSRKALKGYQHLIPSQQYPPLTWPVTKVIAVDMVKRGRMLEAIGTLLAFDCYLRISELLGLMHEDIVPGTDARMGGGGADRVYLRLRRTKTGLEQGVEINDREVKTLAMMARNKSREGCHTDEPFVISSHSVPIVIVVCFNKVCRGLTLSAGYVPHSLRHGGATYGHLCGMSLTDVAHRGRWASLKTATRYIQSGRQALIASTLPSGVIAAAESIHSLLDSMAAQLPKERRRVEWSGMDWISNNKSL